MPELFVSLVALTALTTVSPGWRDHARRRFGRAFCVARAGPPL